MALVMMREYVGSTGMSSHRVDRTSSVPEGLAGQYRSGTDSDPSSTGSDPGNTGRPQRCPSRARRGPSGLGTAIRRFGRGEHGGAAIESAIAIAFLVVGFAGLMEVVQACYTDDRTSRAARAAARAFALDPTADACAAIRRELDLADAFDCSESWTLKVHLGVSPDALPATPDASVTTGTGDMVLVWIEWRREVWSFGEVLRETNAEDSIEDTDETEADADRVPMTAMGLARCEIELCGQEAS